MPPIFKLFLLFNILGQYKCQKNRIFENYIMVNKKIPIMSLDNSFTFGGAIISLSNMLRAADKTLLAPIIVSGQPLEYIEKKFPGCTCYHFVPKLQWVDNHTYLKLTAMWPFRQSRLLFRALNIARFCYRVLFINFPEAIKYVRISRRHAVRLIHLNNGIYLPHILASKINGVPCVCHTRGFAKANPVVRFLANMIDHHVAISSAVQENLIQLGVPEDRITLVHDAVDLKEFNTDVDFTHILKEFGLIPKQPTYGIFGRVIGWKGIREFILAAAEVSRKIPDARGFVVGDISDGDEKFFHEMQNLRSNLGLEDKIIFTGYRKDVPAIMALMNIIVHASIQPEPFGMVIIEGMAAGKPIVATRAGGPLDIVEDGETGYLVEMGDSIALGESITTLLRDPVLCKTMGKKGRERVEKLFDNKLHAAKMEKVFLKFCSTYSDFNGLKRPR